MAKAKTHAQLKRDLESFLSAACPGIEVEVDRSEHWKRTCFTFRWPGFEGMLLEQRFRRIARLIPPEYFEAHCRGVVWLELTPTETIEDYLAQPRSEDIDDRIPEIWRNLRELSFFAALEDELVRIPVEQCPDDFSTSCRVLETKGATPRQRQDAQLAFIRKEAYNDWEVLKKVRPEAEAVKGRGRK